MTRFGIATTALSALLVGGIALVVLSMQNEAPQAVATTVEQSPPLRSSAPTTTKTTLAAAAATTTVPTTTTTSVAETTTSSIVTATTTTTVPASSSTTVTPAPPFFSSVATVTAEDLFASWSEGCPVPPSELREVTLAHWNYKDEVQTGRIIVAASLVDSVVAIFADLYEAQFPIQRMEPVEAFGGDDNSSMAANNTSAFNCREITGGSSFSEHSYGRAIDLNPLVNPYVNGSTVLPPEGSAYADRSLDAPGMIHAGDEVVTAFADRGWIWGGTWTSLKDYQHFSTTGN